MTNDQKTYAPSTDPTRAGALALLAAVLDRHRPLEEAMDALPAMEPRDRAAAHRLAAAAIRRRGTIDAVLEPYLARTPSTQVMHILRLGAAGLLFLDTPPHAAVGTAVDLARAKGLPKFAGMVNAVLRRVSEGGRAALEELDSPRLDTPPWLWTSWGSDARDIATAHQTEAPLDLTMKPGATPPEGGVLLSNGSVRFPAGTHVTELAGFEEGNFWVQDAAAALPAMLLGALPGQRIADLCAAPGGKTAQLAASGAHVTAVESNAHRMQRLTANMVRLGLAADLVRADAAKWRPEAPLDGVLLDAPCSATGTIRRHPDVPYLKKQSDIATLTVMQDQLLAAATGMLKPGGKLVYAVCSLQPEEGPARAAAAVARLPLDIDPIKRSELPELAAAIGRDGTVRTHPGLWPQHGSLDGFFIARFTRV
ncbi:RsmB/NOP family class I SAM-dependent RNA methyltransferase [Acidisoma cladoniae]|uniref:RsmB/NOP family class I SAM-dependent RNA methyltransferase n=1 Tax=Acidisoma cladoniae TaxID=3040935 RepID=UPI00254FCF2E|nr:transcription antitermination factor NusB [Acidisoma sp. PAMC 29798]